eukprot:1161454-Pelagomonas_calceolata.AAC.1
MRVCKSHLHHFLAVSSSECCASASLMHACALFRLAHGCAQAERVLAPKPFTHNPFETNHSSIKQVFTWALVAMSPEVSFSLRMAARRLSASWPTWKRGGKTQHQGGH